MKHVVIPFLAYLALILITIIYGSVMLIIQLFYLIWHGAPMRMRYNAFTDHYDFPFFRRFMFERDERYVRKFKTPSMYSYETPHTDEDYSYRSFIHYLWNVKDKRIGDET